MKPICQFCGNPLIHIGKDIICSHCWEIILRVTTEPELVRKILEELAPKDTLKE